MRLSVVSVALTLPLLVAVMMSSGASQEKKKKIPLQSEGWTIIAEPYRGAGHESLPVEVVSLAMKDAGYEFRITDVSLKNRSSKSVREVEINWRLVKAGKDGGTVIREGLPTKRLFPNDLSVGDELALKFPVINIRKVLLGRLEVGEDYRIEVAVTNVFYTDGTSWKPRRVIRLI